MYMCVWRGRGRFSLIIDILLSHLFICIDKK